MTLTENHVLDNTGFVLNCKLEQNELGFVSGEEHKHTHTSTYVYISCLEMLKAILIDYCCFSTAKASDMVEIYRHNKSDEKKPQIRFSKYVDAACFITDKKLNGYYYIPEDIDAVVDYCLKHLEGYVADRDKKGLHFINVDSLKSSDGYYSVGAAGGKEWQLCIKQAFADCMRDNNCNLRGIELFDVAGALVKVVETNKDDCPLLEIYAVNRGYGLIHQVSKRQIGEVVKTYAQYLFENKARIYDIAPFFFEKPFKKTGFIHYHLSEAGLPCYRKESEAEPLIVGTGGQMLSPTQTRVQVLAKSIDNLLDMINKD